MPREQIHSDSITIDQPPPIMDKADREEGNIVIADESMNSKSYLDELAFGEEPVTIRIEPSTDKNAATAYPVWVNGKGAEVFQRGRWEEITYLPVGRVLTIKRKYLAVMACAKLDSVHTEVKEPESERPNNIVNRFTSAVLSFSVIEDRNPKGIAWLTELRRRNM